MRYLLAAAVVAVLLAVGCSGDGGSGGPPDLVSHAARRDLEDSLLARLQTLTEGDYVAARERYSEACRESATVSEIARKWALGQAFLGNDEDSEFGISGLELVEQQGAHATVRYALTLDGALLAESNASRFVWEQGEWRINDCFDD